jgi:hypothetical protein
MDRIKAVRPCLRETPDDVRGAINDFLAEGGKTGGSVFTRHSKPTL